MRLVSGVIRVSEFRDPEFKGSPRTSVFRQVHLIE